MHSHFQPLPMVAKTKTHMGTIRSKQMTSGYICIAINKYSDIQILALPEAVVPSSIIVL